MEKLTMKKKLAVVRQYLSGLSYDEIAAKSGISKGMVANIVAELKGGGFPEAADVGEQIELLRELSLDIKHSGLTPGQCAVGLALLNRINECGLDAADIGRWPTILKTVGSEQGAKEFVEIVYRIQEAQKKMGLTLEEADDKLHELEMKAAELEPALKQLEDYRQEIEELIKTRDKLTPVVSNLDQKYALLDPRVKDLENREKGLLQRIKQEEAKTEEAETTLARLSKAKQELQDAGFSVKALAEFDDRTRAIAIRHHIAVSELKDRLLHELECLDEGLGLETLIQSRQAELGEREQATAAAKKELESLKTVIGSLKQEKASLEATIKETREKVSIEMAKITAAARDMINTLAEELRRGHDEALAEVRRLKDEAVEVGKEVGRYEEMIQANQWLSELLALVRGEESVEGKRVRVIALLVLRGAAAWLKHNEVNNLAVSTMSFTLENLIREVEQWKV